MDAQRYRTRGGVEVVRTVIGLALEGAIEPCLDALDSQRGLLLASSYEVPGRYTRWSLGFYNPPLLLEATGRALRIEALNARGEVLLPAVLGALEQHPALASLEPEGTVICLTVRAAEGRFSEEQRSRQPSVFSVLRAVRDLFFEATEPHLGLYGAFGYDLAFQFEPVTLRLPRPARQRDLVLYLPDELVAVDHQRDRAQRFRYEFKTAAGSTEDVPRTGVKVAFKGSKSVERPSDSEPGDYAALVHEAKKKFKAGDLFEVVPGQTFFEACEASPAELFRRLRERNPSPYGFLANLGDHEYLVGASPEMFVRVEGNRVETCPISGTIARGTDALSDAAQIFTLLSSSKDESELTMCTDVDRNDKSRVCEPASVRVIGRRQIELYSRVIHTVDHVEGRLRPEFDALDAFLAHTWAVTVTGAPKQWAMQFVEDHEKSTRAWYGGAVGALGFDGKLNTGLTLRTIRILDGVASVRVGATLLYDSDPEAEEKETHTKASAMLDAIRRPRRALAETRARIEVAGPARRVVMVDHQDSFVHTLAAYFRQTGAQVTTLRAGFPQRELDALRPELIVLSPGPGRPKDFDVSGTIAKALARGVPCFGVCLGLQGMVEHFGGELGVLDVPMHGKPSRVRVLGGKLFAALPQEFTAGRYHSLYARRDGFPAELEITAESSDGVVMALEHRSLPLAAVQFHPESILSLQEGLGTRLIHNVVERLRNP